jgi:hypothetical protein
VTSAPRGGATSPETTTLFFALGAAALALWVDVRFPKLGPPSVPLGFVLHVAFVLLVCRFLVPSGLAATAGSSAMLTLFGLFAIGLPGLVYVFLVGVWTLRLVRAAAQSFR